MEQVAAQTCKINYVNAKQLKGGNTYFCPTAFRETGNTITQILPSAFSSLR